MAPGPQGLQHTLPCLRLLSSRLWKGLRFRHALDVTLCVIETATLYERQGLSNDDHERN